MSFVRLAQAIRLAVSSSKNNNPRRHKQVPTRSSPRSHHVVLPQGPWRTWIEFLKQRFPAVSDDTWEHRMALGQLWLEPENSRIDPTRRVAVTPCQPYRAGGRLHYIRQDESEPDVPYEPKIVFENDCIVVADKPHFLPVAPVGPFVHNTLQSRLRHRLGLPHLQVAHRLDRETAGLVLLTKHPEHRGTYQTLFAQQRIAKQYLAASEASGEPLDFPTHRHSRIQDSGCIFLQTEVPGPPNASTLIERLGQLKNGWTLFRLTPTTGRKHQLRVHMNALGCPIAGDRFYPQPQPQCLSDFDNPLQLLAATLAFSDPLTGQTLRFETTLSLNSAIQPDP